MKTKLLFFTVLFLLLPFSIFRNKLMSVFLNRIYNDRMC